MGDLQSAANEIGPAKPKFIDRVAFVPLVDSGFAPLDRPINNNLPSR